MAKLEPGFLELLLKVFTDYPAGEGHKKESMRDRVRHQVKQRREGYQRVRQNLNPKVEEMRRSSIKQFDKLDQAFAKAVVANETEKVWYTLTLMNLMVIAALTFSRPETLHICYTIELAFLIPMRYWMYHQRRWHYFLADLCYYVNGLLLLYLWVWPQSSALWISCFTFSFGSLAASVILWRNSLVLQSVDKVTSSFIHLMPPLITYSINFRIPNDFKTRRFPGAYYTDTWNTVNSLIFTTAAYFFWQVAYHYFITWRRAEKIRNGTVTSFEFMRKRYAKSRLGKFVNNLPGPLPILAFTLIQFSFQMVTMIPCPLYYMHEPLCFAYLLFVFAVASYNGASYYIEVYGERFHKEVRRLQIELAKLEEREEEREEETDPSSETK